MIQTYNPPNAWRMLCTLSDAYEQSHLPKGGISYIPWCIASYYIIKLANARDPISSRGRDSWTTVESDVFRRWNLLYVCCVDILTIFVLLFQK